jgi:hypothetical protein
MDTLTQPCEHPECNCQVTAGLNEEPYCSDVCRRIDTTDEEVEENCPCGHPPCDAE